MKQKRYITEQIILRQADSGQTIEEICREHNISEGSFYRWKKKYGDMNILDVKLLWELEKEYNELKKMLAETMLDNRILREVNTYLSSIRGMVIDLFGRCWIVRVGRSAVS
jgi:putative transposase